MALICSVSGLRFTAEDFSTELIEGMVQSFCKRLPEGTLAVGWDGRQGGEFLEQLVVLLLQKEGRRVHRLGIVPTPTIQTWIARRKLAGGIAVTASHNAAEWYGLKFLGEGGLTLDATLFYRETLSGGTPSPNGHPQWLHPTRWMHSNAVAEHVESLWRPGWLRQLCTRIAAENFFVVVDAVNASASFVVPPLLQRLRCRQMLLYADGSGIFPHPPEPLPQNLQDLSAWVRRSSADVGIALDPDGDRLVLVDETGQCLWEELTIALATQAVLELRHATCRRYQPVVVVNYSTSSVVETVAQRYGARVVRSPVGEANVVRLLRERRGVIGGEGSGGVILPHIHYGRDALVGIVLLLGLMARKQKRLSELVASLPQPVMRKRTLPQPSKPVPSLLDSIAAKIASQAEEVRRDDGLYARFRHGWLHLRASNTEPILRLIVEAPTQAEVEQLEKLVLPLLPQP